MRNRTEREGQERQDRGMTRWNPSYGFGVVLLFVVFQAGFTVAATLLGAPVISAIGWVPIFAANLLAAAAMAGFFWLRHRGMVIEP